VSLIVVAICLTAQTRADDEIGLDFFEKEIRPLLARNCYECHSRDAKKVEGKLLLDTRAGWTRGGRSGAVLIPGEPERSLLIQAVRYEHDRVRMPPRGQLPDAAVEKLVKWVRMGAPDPRDGELSVLAEVDADVVARGREFWSFRPPRRSAPPRMAQSDWPRTDIDRFILEKLQEAELSPVSDADAASLLRRVTLDLTGLPPTPEEIATFHDNISPGAIEQVVDRLLASPRFGERWGRHWFDVARYADSLGSTHNLQFQQAWRYRDYVIESFNVDKSYDRFVREQIAGDLLPAADSDSRQQARIATGFLALSVTDLSDDPTTYKWELIAEQLDTMGRAFLGLTLGCARCHDHKFAPISTRDYYALGGILESTKVLRGFDHRRWENLYVFLRNDRLLALGGEREQQDVTELSAALKEVDDRIIALDQIKKQVKAGLDPPDYDREKIDKEIGELTKRWWELNIEFEKTHTLAMGLQEHSTVSDARIRVQGLPNHLGPHVPRGFLQVLESPESPSPEIPPSASGRKQLAEWLTRRQNPLVARVLVNRVWHYLFGRGLVRTVDDFGPSGERPSHPELLDFLAVEFMDDGWSIKRLIRRIMLSRVYQLGTAHHRDNFEIDPRNVFLWRMTPRRLELEAVRDSMLSVSGNLEARVPVPLAAVKSNDIFGGEEIWGKPFQSGYRTVYIPVLRRLLPPMFDVFDFAPPDQVTGARDVTTVPTQALFLMNSPFVSAQARAAATRLLLRKVDVRERTRRAFLETVGRQPSETELDRTTRYVVKSVGEGLTELDAWSDVYHAQFLCADFLYRN
jgi:hypothetical protein